MNSLKCDALFLSVCFSSAPHSAPLLPYCGDGGDDCDDGDLDAGDNANGGYDDGDGGNDGTTNGDSMLKRVRCGKTRSN